MKVLILNSGMGTRLGRLTDHAPKAMIKIAKNATIISRQLNLLKEAGCKNFLITTGPFEDKLKNHIEENSNNINVVYVNNPDYATTNYIYSIYLAKEFLKDNDILLLHGDLVFSSTVADMIINSTRSNVVVSTTQEPIQDDFKAVIKENFVSKISVDFTPTSLFCQAFYFLKKKDWLIWLNEIETFVESGNKKVYAENALNVITDKLKLYPLDIRDEFCREVDTLEDLAKVRQIQ